MKYKSNKREVNNKKVNWVKFIREICKLNTGIGNNFFLSVNIYNIRRTINGRTVMSNVQATHEDFVNVSPWKFFPNWSLQSHGRFAKINHSGLLACFLVLDTIQKWWKRIGLAESFAWLSRMNSAVLRRMLESHYRFGKSAVDGASRKVEQTADVRRKPRNQSHGGCYRRIFQRWRIKVVEANESERFQPNVGVKYSWEQFYPNSARFANFLCIRHLLMYASTVSRFVCFIQFPALTYSSLFVRTDCMHIRFFKFASPWPPAIATQNVNQNAVYKCEKKRSAPDWCLVFSWKRRFR